MSLLELVAQMRDSEVTADQITVLEESPVGDSKENGFAESSAASRRNRESAQDGAREQA